MCPDTNSPEDSGRSYDGKKTNSQDFTHKNSGTVAYTPHVCPLNRNCRAECRAWKMSQRCLTGTGDQKTSKLPTALRWFAEHHKWHDREHLTNQLKIRLVFRKPVRTAANKLLIGGRGRLSEQIKTEFERLLEMCQPLDDLCGRLIDEEDEAVVFEHIKGQLARMILELADLIESGQKNEECRIKNAETTQQTPETGNQWLTNREAAKILGVRRGTVSKWAKRGRFADNGLKGQKKRLSMASVLLVKRGIEDNDASNDDKDVRDDRRRYK